MNNRVDNLNNSTTNTHQRALDLLQFVTNLTLDINGNKLRRPSSYLT